MKKLIIGMTIISAIILGVVGFRQLYQYGEEVVLVATHQYDTSKTTHDYVKFKSVIENEPLLTSFLEINNSFLTTSPIKKTNKKQLNKSTELLGFFPSIQSYHIAKRKIEKAIFAELPNLHKKISGLNESELETFLSANKTYLDKNFGITDSFSLELLAFSLSQLKNGNIIDCYVVSDSIIRNSFDNSTLFNIVITTAENEKILLSVNARLESSSSNQNSPEIQINGSYGGVME